MRSRCNACAAADGPARPVPGHFSCYSFGAHVHFRLVAVTLVLQLAFVSVVCLYSRRLLSPLFNPILRQCKQERNKTQAIQQPGIACFAFTILKVLSTLFRRLKLRSACG